MALGLDALVTGGDSEVRETHEVAQKLGVQLFLAHILAHNPVQGMFWATAQGLEVLSQSASVARCSIRRGDLRNRKPTVISRQANSGAGFNLLPTFGDFSLDTWRPPRSRF